MKSFLDDLLAEDPAASKEPARARLRVAVAEELLLHMERVGINKAQLAATMGVSRSAVSQALTGSRNMSLNLLADMAAALDLRPSFALHAARPIVVQSARYDTAQVQLSLEPAGSPWHVAGEANASPAMRVELC